MNINQLANLKEIIDSGGAIMSSEWVSGPGRYITSRTIPPLCAKISDISTLKGQAGKSAARILREHPRCIKIIAVVDMRAAMRSIKKMEVTI